MQQFQGRYQYSPSDLVCFMESPFALWMNRFALEERDRAPARDPENPLMGILRKKGYAIEADLGEAFRQQGRTIVEIKGDRLSEKIADTQQAMAKGIEVIYQAALSLEPFVGFSDFLVKVPGESTLGDYHYEVWDSKLASTVKPSFVVQLCCYTEMLSALQGERPRHLTVALGNGQQERLLTQDYYYYYQALKENFLKFMECFSPDAPPDPATYSSWGDWSNYAEALLLEQDHLFQVANITQGQIKKLARSGIATLTTLAESSLERVTGIPKDSLARLQAQASLQLQTKKRQSEKSGDRRPAPCFKILVPEAGQKSGLALLPPASPLDIFFDIEGYPLDQGGLEYLWGSTYFDEAGDRQFKDFWAHDAAQEKVAFQDFIEWAYGRWQADPTMHIYHYANYEIAACRRLMGRYGICEAEVDRLLRNGVFIDLYKLVKDSLILGEPRYSIKNVEHLYRGDRQTDVGNGGDSVIAYEQWRMLHAQGATGDDWQDSEILRQLRDYNRDDCDSTQELVAWLRVQQQHHGIAYLGQKEPKETTISEAVTERTLLCDRLLARAETEAIHDPQQQALTTQLAWLLEFHRREAKPTFWRLFERQSLSHGELIDDLDCLGYCERTERPPFKATAKARHLAYEYRFASSQGFKGTGKSYYLLGEALESGKFAKVTLQKTASDLARGLVVVSAKAEPPRIISLIPDEHVRADIVEQAIAELVEAYEQETLAESHPAILDFLQRQRPRFTLDYAFPTEGRAIAPSPDPIERLEQIITAVEHLDRSYLTIQGPPGSGKSYTGKHIIAALVKKGAKVGISSNSHKAIQNLLVSTAQFCRTEGIHAEFFCTKVSDGDRELFGELGIVELKNNQLASRIQPGCVFGTTVWGFARADMAETLDYLFIDEAGQVAVANFVAMARSAKNIILMGDQQQLGQPSQGSHPGESGLSCLDYLLSDRPTISPEQGVFLGTTYRMHSQINRAISQHIYAGQLCANPDNNQRYLEISRDAELPLNQSAGIVFIPVEHHGNSQAAPEEVECIKSLAHSLLGRTLHTGNKSQPIRLLSWSDMLFVAPYNHQVQRLQQALGEQAKVGSVDKFQGQEAPIVFLSMCASDGNSSPRGLNFLFDHNRLNVAISRAQVLAVIVGNPNLRHTAVSTIEQLKLVNVFNAFTQHSGNT